MLGSCRFFELLALHSALSQRPNQIADHTRQAFERFCEQVGGCYGNVTLIYGKHTSHEALGIFWYIKKLTETLDCRALDFVAQREIRQNFSAQVKR
jgi:hypothetical protein